MTADDLACRELVELVTDYLEGALDPAEHDRFELHLAGCSHCRSYVQQIRATIALAGRAEPEHLSPDARERLLEAFRGWRGGG